MKLLSHREGYSTYHLEERYFITFLYSLYYLLTICFSSSVVHRKLRRDRQKYLQYLSLRNYLQNLVNISLDFNQIHFSFALETFDVKKYESCGEDPDKSDESPQNRGVDDELSMSRIMLKQL